VGGNQSSHRRKPPPPTTQERLPQQSALVLQPPLVWLQHVPLSQLPQHSLVLVQEEPSKRHVRQVPVLPSQMPLQH
jgi:hypothetical protein